MRKAFGNQADYDIPWTVEKVKEKHIQIQLNFSDPKTISQYSEKDSLIIRFNKGAHLLSEEENFYKELEAQLSGDLSDDQNFDIAELMLPVSFTLSQDFILTKIIPK